MKVTRIPVTHFAPAERVPIQIIHRQAAALQAVPLSAELLDSVLNYVFILNQQRQIVFASRSVLDLVPGKKRGQLLGLRPGEALGCIHAEESQGGCGTAKSCRLCGAANAILRSLAGRRDLREYRLTRFIGCRKETLDLLVMAIPLVHKRETFSLLAITDSADAKSRQAMERLFTQGLPVAALVGEKPKPSKAGARLRASRQRGH